MSKRVDNNSLALFALQMDHKEKFCLYEFK